MSFTVYPALDIRNGCVVRLLQGDYAQQTTYGDDALPRAQAFAAAGACWMHLVDLDAAKAGGYTLAALLAQIASTTTLKVQTGGGVRGRDDVARILDAGASRVVIGSLAVREPDDVLAWLSEFGPEHLTIALDTRQGVDGVWRAAAFGPPCRLGGLGDGGRVGQCRGTAAMPVRVRTMAMSPSWSVRWTWV